MKLKSSLLICATLLALSGCGEAVNPEPENVLNSIEIDSSLAKVEYKEGDLIDPSNLLIKCNWAKGEIDVHYEECPNEFSFLPSLETELKASDTSVTVTFKGKSSSYGITVSEKEEYDEYTLDFSSIDLGSKRQIFGTEDDFTTLVNEALNDQVEEDLLTGINVTANNSVKLEQSDFPSKFENVQGLIIGTSKYDGEIEFQFSRKLHSVSIEIQQYYNIFLEAGVVKTRYDGQRYVEEGDDYYYEGYYEVEVNEEKVEGSGVSYTYDDTWQVIELDPPVIPEIETQTVTIDDTSLSIYGFAAVRTRIYKLTLQFEK